MNRTRLAAAGAALALGVALIGACSSGSPGAADSPAAPQGSQGSQGSQDSQDSTGTGSLDGGGGLIVVFMPSTSNVYLGADADAIKAEAKELNYQVKVIENNFDQNEQDQQVQQWLASGEKAAAILYWPASADAGINSSRLLAAQAPVFQFNQPVPDDAWEFVTAYAGVSDYGIGSTAGTMALQALEEDKAAGRQFHGGDGAPTMIEIPFPTGYKAGDERTRGFAEKVGDSFQVLATEPVPTVDAQGGFEAASQIVPRFKSEGIDYIYAHSNNIAVGVIKALEQNGLVPGKDVVVISGDYSGDKQPLRDGKVYSSVVQSPVIEGMLAVDTVARYLATGSVEDKEVDLEAEATKPPLEATPPARITIMPNPPIQASNYDSFTIWGMHIEELVF